MKIIKFSVFLLAVILTFSASAKKVEIQTAMLAGKNFYFERAGLHHFLPYNSISLTLTRTFANNNEPLFYIFSVNSKGFVIVSGDDACTPVLGYSFEDIYSSAAEPEALTSLLQAYRAEVTLVKSQGLQADDKIRLAWACYSSADFSSKQVPLNPSNVNDVQPLMTSSWDQTFPYNAMCPADPASGNGYNGRVPVGCVATAMSQIMYYWRWPNQGSGTHCYNPSGYPQQCADFGNTTYNWNAMNNQPQGECDPVATLSWHTGVSVNMQYGANGSGAYLSDVPHSLSTYFRYSNISHYAKRTNYPGTTWHDSLQSNLDKGHPILYEGFNPSEGHAFVFDGYQSGNYYHVNWGWSGANNGYFLITNLNPGGITFNNNQGAVFSIVPNPSQYPPFCQGNTNVTTGTFGSIEDGSGPVQNYQPNSNCSWLIAPDDSILKITLSFDRFALSAGDELKVYNGNSAASPLLGTYTGSTPPASVASIGGSLFLVFTSVSSSPSQGFEAQYTATPAEFCSSSSIVLSDLNGSFTDGSGTFQYRNSSNCKWRITPSVPVSAIMISFPVFETEQDKDVVTIYDLITSQQIAQFSGSPATPPSVIANTSNLLIMFNTNSSIRGNGWNASYSTIVGMNEWGNLKSISVYPNPVKDLLNINLTLGHAADLNYELLDLKGISMYSEKSISVQGNILKTIDVSLFPKGVYCLKVSSNEGIVTKKIVLQ